MVTFSIGLATQGMTPFCNIYSTFMQRAYDQVIHDVSFFTEFRCDILFRQSGFCWGRWITHHGVYDISYFRCIPNMIVSASMNEQELRNLMYTASTS